MTHTHHLGRPSCKRLGLLKNATNGGATMAEMKNHPKNQQVMARSYENSWPLSGGVQSPVGQRTSLTGALAKLGLEA